MKKYFTTRLSREKYFLYGFLSNPLSVMLLLLPILSISILTEFFFGGSDMYGLTIIDNLYNLGFLGAIIFCFILILPLVILVIFISCSIRRVNDIGISRWFILFLFFYPFSLNVLFLIFLLFKSGESKNNKWGEPV
jgi:uncharacterized membrane protein YhaH (DUF805 family)